VGTAQVLKSYRERDTNRRSALPGGEENGQEVEGGQTYSTARHAGTGREQEKIGRVAVR